MIKWGLRWGSEVRFRGDEVGFTQGGVVRFRGVEVGFTQGW